MDKQPNPVNDSVADERAVERAIARSLSRRRRATLPKALIAAQLSSQTLKTATLRNGRITRVTSFEAPHGLAPESATWLEPLARHLAGEARAARCRSLVFIVPASRIRTLVIDLPRLEPKDLASALAMRALRMISGRTEEWNISASCLGRAARDKENLLRYQVIAVEALFVKQLSQLFDGSGLLPLALVPESSLLARLIAPAEPAGEEPDPEAQIWVIAQLSRATSTIHIYTDGNLAYTRTVPIGGEHLTKALTDVVATEDGFVELSEEQAEDLKREIGYPDATMTGPLPGFPLEAEQVRMMLEPKLNSLALEIRNSIRYFQQQSGLRKISRLVLTGGCARMNGLDRFLQAQLKIPPRKFAVQDIGLDCSRLDPVQHSILFDDAPALAAALRGPDLGQDLLPPAFGWERRLRTPFRIFSVTAAALIVIVSFLAFLTESANARARDNLELRPHQETDIGLARQDLIEQRARLREEQVALRSALGRSSSCAELLADLSRRIPASFALEQALYTAGSDAAHLSLSGSAAIDGEDAQDRTLRQVIAESIAASPYIANLELRRISKQDGSSFAFDLMCRLFLQDDGRLP